MSLQACTSLIILSSDGKRVFAKYWDDKVHASLQQQRDFEARLFQKVRASGANGDDDVALIDGQTVVFVAKGELVFAIGGRSEENELVLQSALTGLVEAIGSILHDEFVCTTLADSMDVVLIAIDELFEDGIIMDTEGSAIGSRVMVKTDSDPLSDQSLAQAFGSVRKLVANALR